MRAFPTLNFSQTIGCLLNVNPFCDILAIKPVIEMSIQAIKEELRKLNKTEQAELMHFMVELLASDGFELSDKWKAELDRREEALYKKTSTGKTAKEVIAKYISR